MAQLRIAKQKNKKPEALQITFTSSTTYTIEAKWKSMDVFVVNGGNHGYAGGRTTLKGGDGGGSGYTKTEKDISITSDTINVTIGNGATSGRGGTSSINVNGTTISPTAQTTTIINGGCGGGAGGKFISGTPYHGGNGGTNGSDGHGNGQSSVRGGIGQHTTTKAFEEEDEVAYSGAGAGGGNITNTGDAYGGRGGQLGGGDGGYPPGGGNNSGMPGTNNTGGGGGGGVYWTSTETGALGGNGGSGIVIVRLYKDSNRPEIVWDESNMITIN